ncbi:hypothetical protein [Catenovulum maritimum]|uniref:hypothetical protein n=1 Tax=Catenovulum maritimum TaxID=1513271 RepID=UPI001C0FDEF7|nr:hypothetical protein [Catenovulum maritimum]
MFVALALVITSGYEVYESFEEANIGAHHGVFVFALFQMLKCIAVIGESVLAVDEAISASKSEG